MTTFLGPFHQKSGHMLASTSLRHGTPSAFASMFPTGSLSIALLTKKHCFAPLTRLNLIIGAGNISDVGSKPTERRDKDIIPDAAVRPSMDGRDYHTGRGGAGNAQTAAAAERKSEEKLVTEKPAIVAPVGLADKLKAMIFGGKKK